MVPPCSDRISRVPPYSRIPAFSTRTGLSPTEAALSRAFRFLCCDHWPSPRSLATTNGVSVDVLSSGYLDVSVPRVCLHTPMYSGWDHPCGWGCPIRISADQRSLASPRGLTQRATSFIASYRQGIHQMPLSYLIFVFVDAVRLSCEGRSESVSSSTLGSSRQLAQGAQYRAQSRNSRNG